MEASPSTCTNCGATFEGRFCNRCGQEAKDKPDSLAGFITASAGESFSLQSRVIRSLAHLVARPGEVTVAYLSGKRARYTQPLQLYLIAAASFYLVNSFRPFASIRAELDPPRGYAIEVVANLNGSGFSTTRTDWRSRPLPTVSTLQLFKERFRTALSQSMPAFMFGAIVVFAGALALFNSTGSSIAHIVFSLHWIAFFMLIMTVDLLIPAGLAALRLGLFTVAALLHLVFSLRRVYGNPWPRAMLSGVALLVVFQLVIAGWIWAVVAYAFRHADIASIAPP